MKRRILLALMMITGFLQAQNFTWVNQIGGTLNQKSNALVTDLNGNVYTTGYFEGVVDFDPGPGILTLTSAGGYDIFITKSNAAGVLIWVKQIGGVSSSDEGKSIAVGANGDVYVTGTFRDAVDFNPGIGEFYMQPVAPYFESCTTGTDVFVLKLNSDGDFNWARQVGGNGFDEAVAITLGSGESVYVAGEYVSEFNVPVDFDPTAGTFFMTPLAGAGAFMLKLDADGNFFWAKQWYSSSIGAAGCGIRDADFHPLSLAIDGSGNVHCTGDFGSTVDFDPNPGIYSVGTLSNAAFVMKLNSDGEFQWARALNNSGNHAYGKDVIVGSNGHVYSVGLFDGTIDFDPGTGTKNLKAPGGSGPSGIGPSDAYVWVLNSLGNYIWAGQLGGNTSDFATSIDLDGTGNMYVSGAFTGTADFNPGIAKNTLKAAGDGDIYVTKLTTTGSYIWAIRLGGTSADYATALDVDIAGAILTTGTFQGTADFDPSSITYPLTSLGLTDAFVHKMSQSGGAFAPPSLPQEPEVIRATLFPNPTEDVLNVDVGRHAEHVNIQLFNLNGQLLLEKTQVSGRIISLDVSAFPGGMYMINLQEGSTSTLMRVVKN